MSPSKLQTELRSLVRARIKAGVLPCATSIKYRGVAVRPGRCDVRTEIVGADDVELQIHIAASNLFGDRERALRFNRLCYEAWQCECTRAEFIRDGHEDSVV